MPIGLSGLVSGCAEPPWDAWSVEHWPEAPGRERFASVAGLLDANEGRISAVVMDSRGRTLFEHKPKERYELASVAKVYILLGYLDRISQEQRHPSPDELESMRAMITYSDNDSATRMFWTLGGADGINAFLQARGQAPLEPAHDGSWGSMRTSATDVGKLLTHLYRGGLLDATSSGLALSMLANVVDEQAWGVGRAADREREALSTSRTAGCPRTTGGSSTASGFSPRTVSATSWCS